MSSHSRFHLDTEWFGWNSPFLFPGVFAWQKCITEDRGSRTLLLDGSGAGWRLRHSYDTAFGTFSGSEEGAIRWYLGSTSPPGPRMQWSPREMTALIFFGREFLYLNLHLCLESWVGRYTKNWHQCRSRFVPPIHRDFLWSFQECQNGCGRIFWQVFTKPLLQGLCVRTSKLDVMIMMALMAIWLAVLMKMKIIFFLCWLDMFGGFVCAPCHQCGSETKTP